MLDIVTKCYEQFRLVTYRSLFRLLRERDSSLSAAEAFSVDVIYLLGQPTIKQFADCLGISQPNATYKVSHLIQKGYVTKSPSQEDRRESHLQVTEKEYDRILTEAMALVKLLGKNTFIKIPATDVGLKATHYLSDMGYRITVTAVLSATQAMLAANSGASYVAPYISRLENICDDGVGCAADIVKIFQAGNSRTQVLAASFKTAKEVLDVAVIGCHAATVSSDILRKMLAHTTTNTSIADFDSDWKKAFGVKTLLSMLEH